MKRIKPSTNNRKMPSITMKEMKALGERYNFDPKEGMSYLKGLSDKKVKRARSAYLFYSMSKRESLKSLHPEKKMTELSKMIGESWKCLSEEDREPYTRQALEDKKRYESEKGSESGFEELTAKKKNPQKNNSDSDSDSEPEAPTLKIAKKKRTILPFCGKIVEEECHAIRKNHGLYTQCTMSRLSGETLCKTCHSHLMKKGELSYGTVENRESLLSKVKVVRYSTVMLKLGISREEAEDSACSLGWSIPEVEFEKEDKKRVGKKAKVDPVVSSSDDDGAVKPKKKGRKKKDRRVTSAAEEGDDLISSLIEQAEEEEGGNAEAASTPDTESNPPEEEDEESVNVRKFEHDGVTYYRDDEGRVFDPDTEELIGKWDEKSCKIVEMECY